MKIRTREQPFLLLPSGHPTPLPRRPNALGKSDHPVWRQVGKNKPHSFVFTMDRRVAAAEPPFGCCVAWYRPQRNAISVRSKRNTFRSLTFPSHIMIINRPRDTSRAQRVIWEILTPSYVAWWKELGLELKNRSHESKLLLPHVNRNGFLGEE